MEILSEAIFCRLLLGMGGIAPCTHKTRIQDLCAQPHTTSEGFTSCGHLVLSRASWVALWSHVRSWSWCAQTTASQVGVRGWGGGSKEK